MMLSLIFWIVFCTLEGIRDAGVFSHNRGDCNSRYPFNIHRFFIPSRVLVCTLLSLPFDGWLFGVRILCLWGCLSFFHNGAYYQARRLLEPGESSLDGYWYFYSKSSTTTAKFSFGVWPRTIFAGVGLTIYFFT